MTNIPIWDRPNNFSASEHEGRMAFLDGLPKRHRYEESLSGKDWERGWMAEKARAERR